LDNHRSAHSPEVRKMARVAEQLRPEYRKIALSLIASLKKHEDSIGSGPERQDSHSQ